MKGRSRYLVLLCALVLAAPALSFTNPGSPCARGRTVLGSHGDEDVDFADFQALAANLNGPGSGSCASRVNPFGFTGQRVDVLAGGALVLYDYKARVYDPRHGRFQQRDPSEFADTYNLYEYAASRVTVLTDPTGAFLVDTLATIGLRTYRFVITSTPAVAVRAAVARFATALSIRSILVTAALTRGGDAGRIAAYLQRVQAFFANLTLSSPTSFSGSVKLADLGRRFSTPVTALVRDVLNNGIRFLDQSTGNINVWLQKDGYFVRITLDPSGSRIISAGLNRLRDIFGGIERGRFIPLEELFP